MHKNRRRVRVEWGHCDAAQIVFYPRYFEWFDQSTFHLFDSAGVNLHQLIGQDGRIGAPLVNVTAKFIAPSRHGDDIDIESEFVELGRASFKVAHRIYNREVLAVEGLESRVWAGADPADPKRIKAIPIPNDIVARLKA
jgi:4-hydroxybenzoyl-CoA thioesterase